MQNWEKSNEQVKDVHDYEADLEAQLENMTSLSSLGTPTPGTDSAPSSVAVRKVEPKLDKAEVKADSKPTDGDAKGDSKTKPIEVILTPKPIKPEEKVEVVIQPVKPAVLTEKGPKKDVKVPPPTVAGDQRSEVKIVPEEKEDDLLKHIQGGKKKKKKKGLKNIMWVTREMAEKLGREYILLTTLKDTIYFLIFLILSSIVNLGLTDNSTFQLFSVMNDQLLQDNEFYNVATAADFWTFLESAFTKSFYWDYWYYPDFKTKSTNKYDRNVFYENKLIGVPRLRQVKVRNDSCLIHRYFKGIFLSCYGQFSASNEDTSSFGPGNSSAWKYHPESELRTTSYWGKLGWYHGAGYYQDLSLVKTDTLSIIESLKANLWITRGTRAVFLDFSVYNTNINRFCVIRAAFEFPPTGGVIPTSSVKVVKLLRYTNMYDYFILACELALISYILYYTMEELREFIYFKFSYLKKFWSYIDSGILFLGYAAILIGIFRSLTVGERMRAIVKNPDAFIDLDVLATAQTYYNNFLAIQLFFIYLKLFKYLNFNKSMAQLNNTLSKCRKDMLGFALMFFVIFLAFAVLGYLLFGMEVEDFSGFLLSMFTLLRTILGDFDYTRIEKANRVLAPIFFLCFIFLVFFVLLNMFLAIINDTYTDVKTEIAIAPEELRMSGFIKRGYYNMLIKLGCGKYVKTTELNKNEYQMAANEIKVALRRLGFSNLEIEMFFARYNIDPNAEVTDYDVQTLLDALEGKEEKAPPKVQVDKPKDEGKPLIAIDDFIKQQERLDEIEETIHKATTAMNTLLSKLDQLENVRKMRKANKEEAQE